MNLFVHSILDKVLLTAIISLSVELQALMFCLVESEMMAPCPRVMTALV